MSDKADYAEEITEAARNAAIAAARKSKPQLPCKGACYNCDEPLGEGLRFCDADCRDDFVQRRNARQR